MSGEWESKSIAELVSIMTRGITPVYTEGDGIYVVNQKCIRDGRMSLASARKSDTSKKAIPSTKLLLAGDVLINSTGQGTLGRVAQLGETTIPMTLDSHVTLLRPNQAVVEPAFLGWSIKNSQSIIESMAEGSTGQTELPREKLAQLSVPLPPLPEQRRIAKILGDLDDKIELNRKMNETLEQMARALFKSWFVDFDPVRAKMEGRTPTGMDAATAALFPDRLVDSELGPIPEGWEVKALGEVIECVKGRSYRSEELAESTTALVTLKSFLRGGGYRPDGLKPFIGEYKSNQRVYPGDLVIALTDVTQAADVIGKPALIRSDKQFDTLVASLDVGIIRPTDEIVSKPFLYCLFMTESFQTHAYSHSTGTTVLHLGSSAVPSYVTVLPPALVSQKFDEMAGLMVRLIDENEIQSRTLSTLRDTLLPKLVSGEVRV